MYQESNERWTSHGKNNRIKTVTEARASAEKMIQWWCVRRIRRRRYMYSMGPTGLDVIRRFRFVYPARRPHWKRSETIKQYTTAALPVSRWKHFENVLKTLENDWNQTSYQVNKRNLSIALIVSARSAPRYLIEWIISNTPGWREIASVRRMDFTQRIWSGFVQRIRKYSSSRGDRSMSINRWSWTLSFTTTICFFGKGRYFLYKEKCYDELSQFWNSKYIGMRKSVGWFKNLDFES